jgi:hypothetical protein
MTTTGLRPAAAAAASADAISVARSFRDKSSRSAALTCVQACGSEGQGGMEHQAGH